MKKFFLSFKERFLVWIKESEIFIESMLFGLVVFLAISIIMLLLANLFIFAFKIPPERVWVFETVVVFLYGLFIVSLMYISIHEQPVIKNATIKILFWSSATYFLVIIPGLVALIMFDFSQRVMLKNYWQWSWPSLLTLLGTHILFFASLTIASFIDEMKRMKVSERK